MTAADVQTAAALLTNLANVRAAQSAFEGAANYQITASASNGNVVGIQTFPASVYASAVTAAFTAQIGMLTDALTALGVTGF